MPWQNGFGVLEEAPRKGGLPNAAKAVKTMQPHIWTMRKRCLDALQLRFQPDQLPRAELRVRQQDAQRCPAHLLQQQVVPPAME